jgi:glycosyltransferase involved in cell wall biosynthesis
MCTFNGERFLRPQLESVRSQTLLPDEMVISDDSSSDGTLAVLQSFVAHAPFPITLIQNAARLGPTKNFEQAALRAGGDVIFFADQDDIWEADKIRVMMAALQANPTAEMVVSDGRCIDSVGRPLPYTLFDCVGRTAVGAFANRRSSQFRVLLQRDIVTGAACCVRRRLLNACLPFAPNWVQDAWLAFAAARENGAVVLSVPLIRYRVHSSQEVGIRPPRKIGVKTLNQNDRRARLQRFVDLRSFWAASLSREQLEQLDAKIGHLSFRANLPARMVQRAAAILQQALLGNYHRYSLGFRSMALDLVRPQASIRPAE